MKKAVFLAIATLLSSQLLFALYPQGSPGNLPDDILPDGIGAAYPEIPEDDVTTGILACKARRETTADSSGQFLLPVKDMVFHLEFEAEKGITLPGASAVELLNRAPCLTPDFPAITQLNHNYRILVFINDQPTPIRATNVTAALQQIPAESITAIDIRNVPLDISDPADEANIIIRVTKVK